jgi:aerobic carbon-monoxide dehydrogenase medium subunit
MGRSVLSYIEFDPKAGLRLGALTTLRSIEASPLVRTKFAILAQAAHCVGSVQVRNRGTVGGNLCNASPCVDMAPALIGLGARLDTKGISGERVVTAEEFFKGPGKTVLSVDEIITGITVPTIQPQTGAFYNKFGLRKAMDIALLSVAAVIRLDSRTGNCVEARIVLGAVAPIPMRAKRTEEILAGKKIDENLIERAAQEASRECSPISDIRATAEYRREMIRVTARKTIREALVIAEIC